MKRSLRIEGALEAVPKAVDFVITSAREAEMSPQLAHHCGLATDEACTNIIEHGYGETGQGVIDVAVWAQDGHFVVELSDDAPPFDPLSITDTPSPTDRKPGGWGVYLIRKLMDTARYERRGNRNVLTLSKRIVRADAGESLSNLPLQTIEAGSARVIRLGQRVDAAATVELARALAVLLAAGHRWLVIELSALEYISSTALKLLVAMWQRARIAKGELLLAAPSPYAREVLHTTGLDLVFVIAPTTDEALHLLKRGPRS